MVKTTERKLFRLGRHISSPSSSNPAFSSVTTRQAAVAVCWLRAPLSALRRREKRKNQHQELLFLTTNFLLLLHNRPNLCFRCYCQVSTKRSSSTHITHHEFLFTRRPLPAQLLQTLQQANPVTRQRRLCTAVEGEVGSCLPPVLLGRRRVGPSQYT